MRWKPDLLHFHSAFIPMHSLLARSIGVPYVLTPHGAFDSRGLGRRWLRKQAYWLLCERAHVLRAGGVIALTEAERVTLAMRYPQQSRVWVIPNALPSTFISQCRETRRRRLAGVQSRFDCRYGVFLGRLDVHNKGLDLLAKLVRTMSVQGYPIRVYCHGPSSTKQRPAISKLLHRLSGGLVEARGPVYGESKLNLLENAALYFQLSRWEAFGMSIAEALLSGVPCVVSTSSAISPILRAGGGVHVVSPESNLEQAAKSVAEFLRALTTPLNRVQLGLQGARFARKLVCPAIVAGKTSHAYEVACGRARRVSAGAIPWA